MASKLSPWVVVVAAVGMWVTTPFADDDDAEVRLYTNADLRQFGDPEPAPVEGSSEERGDRQREIVVDFLDREYARIETEQRLAIQRSSVQPPETESQDGYDGFGPYVLGGYGGYYGGYYDDGGFYGKPDRGRYRLPPYDLRTARHGYLVPARRFVPDRPRAFVFGAGGGRMTRHAVGHGGSRGHGHR